MRKASALLKLSSMWPNIRNCICRPNERAYSGETSQSCTIGPPHHEHAKQDGKPTNREHHIHDKAQSDTLQLLPAFYD
jgi:hypothetical protein